MASNCCRLCLLSGPDLLPILNLTVNPNGANEQVSSTLSSLIGCYLSIEPLVDGTTIATYICSECRNTIAKWHWFRESCLRNDAVYQKMVQDPVKNDTAGQFNEYHEVWVKQEPEIEIDDEKYSKNLLTVPLEPPSPFKNLENEAEVKQEVDVEIGEEAFRENLLIDPQNPPQNEVLNQKGPSEKSSPTTEERGENPVKKKMGRPRIREVGTKPGPQMCTKCGKLVNNLSAHMMMHKDRRHQCPHCPKTFTSKGMWNYHVNVHTKEIKYTCKVCDKVFWRNETLKMHMKSHSEENTFKCPYCPKAYRMRAGLDVHRKTHTQVPDVPCDKCDRKFYTKSQLYTHAVVHMAVKPFICKICERGFSKKYNLTAHMEKIHPKNTEEAPTEILPD